MPCISIYVTKDTKNLKERTGRTWQQVLIAGVQECLRRKEEEDKVNVQGEISFYE